MLHKLAGSLGGSGVVQVAFVLVAMTGIGSLKKVGEEHSVGETQVDLVVPMGIQNLPDIELGVVLADVEPEGVEEDRIVDENLLEGDMGHLVSLVMPDVEFVVVSEDWARTREEDVGS